MAKKYLGQTVDLTLAHLEDTATQFTEAYVSGRDTSAIQVSSHKRVHGRQQSKAEIEVHALDIGAKATIAQPTNIPGVQRDPLLATKLHWPRPRAYLVSRSHLTERLHQGLEHALTNIRPATR